MYNLLLWASYIGYKSRTLGKIYGIKWGAIRNMLGEHIGKSFGTWWEHNENFMRTTKIQQCHPPLKEKKNLGSFGCMSLHFIGCKNSLCLHAFCRGSWIMRVNSFLVFFSPFAMSHFDWPITKKLHKTLEVPQNRGL